MGIDAFGFMLALLAVGMSMVAIRGRHLLLSVSTAGLWAGLLAFILTNSGVISMDNRTILVVSIVGFIFALLLLGVFRDIKAKSSTNEIPPRIYPYEKPSTVRKLIGKLNSDELPQEPKSSFNESPEDYQARVRAALRRRRVQ